MNGSEDLSSNIHRNKKVDLAFREDNSDMSSLWEHMSLLEFMWIKIFLSRLH